MCQKIADLPGATKAFKTYSAPLWKFKIYGFKTLEFILLLTNKFPPFGNAASKANFNEMDL